MSLVFLLNLSPWKPHLWPLVLDSLDIVVPNWALFLGLLLSNDYMSASSPLLYLLYFSLTIVFMYNII